jgi:hypothetical protein
MRRLWTLAVVCAAVGCDPVDDAAGPVPPRFVPARQEGAPPGGAPPAPPAPGAHSAADEPPTAVLSGEVVDLGDGKPIANVRVTCVAGTPCDGNDPATDAQGRFRWSFKAPGLVELRFAYRGWSVFTPPLLRDAMGNDRPDVVGWTVPLASPQRVEMWRTGVALRAPADAKALESDASRLAELLLRRAAHEDPARRIPLASAWRTIVASPYPVTARVHLAKRILPSVSADDVALRTACATYAEADASAVLRWELALRAADRGVVALPVAFPVAADEELPRVSGRILADLVECTVRHRESPLAGKLNRADVEAWVKREGLSMDRLRGPSFDELVGEK